MNAHTISGFSHALPVAIATFLAAALIAVVLFRRARAGSWVAALFAGAGPTLAAVGALGGTVGSDGTLSFAWSIFLVGIIAVTTAVGIALAIDTEDPSRGASGPPRWRFDLRLARLARRQTSTTIRAAS